MNIYDARRNDDDYNDEDDNDEKSDSQVVVMTWSPDDVVDCDVTPLTSFEWSTIIVVSVTGNTVDDVTVPPDDDVSDDVITSCDDVEPVSVFSAADETSPNVNNY